jgi:AraC family transcriptional regulator, dual regulator of chb operon
VTGVQTCALPILLFIRPSDAHTFRARRAGPMVSINLAFSESIVHHLHARYFRERPDFWGGAAALPWIFRLSEKQRRDITGEIEKLAGTTQTLFMLELFLMKVLAMLKVSASPPESAGNLPDWMGKALEAITQPRYFKKGVPALVELCCRSPEHVARSIKARLGRTPSQIVNDARLEYAVRALSLTNQSIYAIALECGYESLSYFYRMFRGRQGMSPAAFRKKNRGIIDGSFCILKPRGAYEGRPRNAINGSTAQGQGKYRLGDGS